MSHGYNLFESIFGDYKNGYKICPGLVKKVVENKDSNKNTSKDKWIDSSQKAADSSYTILQEIFKNADDMSKSIPKINNASIAKFSSNFQKFLSENPSAFGILDKGLFVTNIIIDTYQDVENGETVGTSVAKNTFINGLSYLAATGLGILAALAEAPFILAVGTVLLGGQVIGFFAEELYNENEYVKGFIDGVGGYIDEGLDFIQDESKKIQEL